MTQTNVPAAGPKPPGFCPSCGTALPGPVQRCPRCGAALRRKSGSGAATAIVIIVACLGCVCFVGVLAAIAIPNFIKYQLRSKEFAVKGELTLLVRAEQARAVDSGKYLAFGPVPSKAPGSQKNVLSPAEMKAARDLDWMIDPATFGQFRVAVAEDPSGAQGAAFCAETDLDGDGKLGVMVAFLPVVVNGETVGAPAAPCTTAVPFQKQYQAGEVIKISEPSVF
jgi:type IV pilus assembly protein PilA